MLMEIRFSEADRFVRAQEIVSELIPDERVRGFYTLHGWGIRVREQCSCTCPDFVFRGIETKTRCKHILAALYYEDERVNRLFDAVSNILEEKGRVEENRVS